MECYRMIRAQLTAITSPRRRMWGASFGTLRICEGCPTTFAVCMKSLVKVRLECLPCVVENGRVRVLRFDSVDVSVIGE